ncbi:MAG: plastocyanin/azurin family copper-binding protein [Longimicrobiales bacterium]
MTLFAPPLVQRRSRPGILVGAVIALSACGGGEPSDAPPPETALAPQGVFGTAPSAAGGTPSVVMLRPAGAPVPLPPRESPTMDQLGLAFSPTFLLARTGETVSFTNSETITHNVRLAFSDNDSTVLDAETDPGAHADFLFDREGGYEVTCDHHPGMRAFVFVTSAPYVVFADNAGAFRLNDVPPGSYTLSVWNVDATRRSERALEVTGPSTEVTFGPAE